MTLVGWSQIALVLALSLVAADPLSAYVARVYAGERNFFRPSCGPVERAFYRLAGVDETREQSWFVYAMAMVVFSIAGFVSLYALQRLQNFLPLNPQGFDAVPPDLAFNTSISFITNTNWQNYGGETTMSHLTQMLGLTVHNFLSAATGLAMAFALVRAFARSAATTVGNFWVDMTPHHALRPAAALDRLRHRLRRARRAADARRLGRRDDARRRQADDLARAGGEPGDRSRSSAPTAAASSTPIPPIRSRTPTPGSNIIENWSLLLIPFAAVLAFGRAVGDVRQGRAIFVTMGILLVVGVGRRLLGRELRATRC